MYNPLLTDALLAEADSSHMEIFRTYNDIGINGALEPNTKYI